MSRRSKIVIAALIVLFLLLLAALFLLPPRGVTPTVNAPAPTTNTPAGGLNVGSPGYNVNISQPSVNAPAAAPKVDEQSSVKIVAKSFAELFGSFSSEGNFQNIVDAEYYMTDSLKSWADSYVAAQRALPKATTFSGTTTRAIFAPDVKAFDAAAGTAKVVVKTRRIETGSTIGSENIYYQDLTLDFKKVGGAWKVNAFTWGPK